MNRLPDFLIIGASRCGTSSLFKNLLRHPKISGPFKNKKELHFFNKPKRFSRGIELYKSQFPRKRRGQLLFEASPAYFHVPVCVCRIAEYLPDCKFIVMLRNPVDRVISYYSRWKVKEFQWNPREVKNPDYGAVNMGIYVKALWRWFGFFPREQFLIIKSEDYFRNDKKIIEECFEWLRIKPFDIGKPVFFDQRNRRSKKLPYRKEVPESVKNWLREFYRPHNLELYKLLGRNFRWQ